jgi:hypothetical protein
MKRRVYCLAVRESLSPVGSLEYFRATLTKNLSNDCCFWENRLNCEYVILNRKTSSTRIAKHCSFIKLKFLQNFCSSCKTLVDKVARNPRFCCIYFPCDKWVPLIMSWRVLRLWMEERSPVWRVAAKVLNKLLGTADKGWSSSLGLGEGLTTHNRENVSLLRNIYRKSFGPGLILW